MADWDPPNVPSITYHDVSDTDLELYWLLAFDGGPDPSQACGLIAREDGDTITGYWTDDREILNYIDAELQDNVDDSPVVAD